jgi:hypothetical protein
LRKTLFFLLFFNHAAKLHRIPRTQAFEFQTLAIIPYHTFSASTK